MRLAGLDQRRDAAAQRAQFRDREGPLPAQAVLGHGVVVAPPPLQRDVLAQGALSRGPGVLEAVGRVRQRRGLLLRRKG